MKVSARTDWLLRWSAATVVAVSLALGLATLVVWRLIGDDWHSVVLALFGFACGIGSMFGLRSEVTRGRLLVALGGLMLAMLASAHWFDGPMHDLSLVIGAHGRWGCLLLDERGAPQYFIRSQTIPLLIFVPLMGLIGWRGAMAVAANVRGRAR
jgi:hypothetical protein